MAAEAYVCWDIDGEKMTKIEVEAALSPLEAAEQVAVQMSKKDGREAFGEYGILVVRKDAGLMRAGEFGRRAVRESRVFLFDVDVEWSPTVGGSLGKIGPLDVNIGKRLYEDLKAFGLEDAAATMERKLGRLRPIGDFSMDADASVDDEDIVAGGSKP